MAWTQLGRVAGCSAFFSLSPLKARAIAFGFSDLSVAVIPAQELVKESASSTVSGFFAAVVILGKGNG
jgi:hypothetical protein